MNIPNVLNHSSDRLPQAGFVGWQNASSSVAFSETGSCADRVSTGGRAKRVAGVRGIVHGKGERT